MHPQYKQKLLDEIREQFKDGSDIKNISAQDWQNHLSYDNIMSSWEYLTTIMQETLRIEPPVTLTSNLTVSETVTLAGKYTIPEGWPIVFNLFNLHRNPKEWQRPDEFLPERWDHSHPLYLTPDGKKRNPASFGPFLGGRRVCLGKTLAENLAKVFIPMIISLVDFKFQNDIYNQRKPLFHLGNEPQYNVIASIRD